MLDPQLLEILRCPVTESRLTEADNDLIMMLNRQIEQQRVQSKLMETLSRPIDGGLINEDRSLLMPIYQGIPDMNPDDAILLTPFEDSVDHE